MKKDKEKFMEEFRPLVGSLFSTEYAPCFQHMGIVDGLEQYRLNQNEIQDGPRFSPLVLTSVSCEPISIDYGANSILAPTSISTWAWFGFLNLKTQCVRYDGWSLDSQSLFKIREFFHNHYNPLAPWEI